MAAEYAVASPGASRAHGGLGLEAAELIVVNQLLDRRMIAADRAEWSRGSANAESPEEIHQEYPLSRTDPFLLSAVMLEGEPLEVFELQKPIPAFRIEGVSFCGKDLIVEMEDSIYRGDMYRFAAKAVR